MNDIKSFSFFDNYYISLKELDIENRKILLNAIVEYMFEDKEPELEGVNKAIWTFIQLSLNTSKERSKISQKDNKSKTKEEQNENKNKSKTNQNKIKSKTKEEQNENISRNHNHNHNHNLKSNINNHNLNNKDIEKEFESLWDIYPNKKGKRQAMQKYSLARKQGATYESVRQGLESYIKYCTIENIENKYIKHGSTWFNQRGWEDDYTISRKATSKDLAKVIDWEEYTNEYK